MLFRSPYSETRLRESLAYDGYSQTDIDAAVANCGADWYWEAKEMADYLVSINPCSYDYMVLALQDNGFTYDQAVAGAPGTYGIDYYYQAYLEAQNYISYNPGCTYADCYDWLIHMLFAPEQAADACTACDGYGMFAAEP